MNRILYTPLERNRTDGTTLLRLYLEEKGEEIERISKTQEDALAAKQQEVADAQQQADQARQEADALRGSVTDLRQQLTDAIESLDAARAAASVGQGDELTLTELQAQVTALTAQLTASAEELSELNRAADLAEDAAAIEADVLEESPPSRYKWHLVIGGVAAVAGLWYYYFKYLPSKAAAPTANPDDEDPVFGLGGRVIGYVSPSAVKGRYIARSAMMSRPLFSAASRRSAENWIREAASRIG